jgi:cyclic beta-1,2-glucan synthetase
MTEWSRELARPLASAALSLAEHCCDFEQPPAPIPALEKIQVALGWLHSARLACADVSPEVEKAAEWLLDNDYQVHRAIRQIRHDLPASFYSRLPVLCDPGTPRFPRVFALAHELLRVTQLQVSLASSVTFVNAYQERQPLTIAELWAFPTMLRIACLEIIVAALTPMLPGVAWPFVPTARAADPHSLDDTGRVARGIANLAVIAAIPWEEFFDSTSFVEKILTGDPSGFYGRTDFETRDHCRRTVEELARYGRKSELDVAWQAVRLSETAAEGETGRHVGHWLIGEGRSHLRQAVAARLPMGQRVRDFVLRHPGPIYAAGLILCGLAAMLPVAWYLAYVDASAIGWLAALAAAFIPATILAVTAVNWAVTRSLPPRILPKLACDKGLPKDGATVIAMPVIVTGKDEAAALAEQMETHWLANADSMLRVALLADLADANEEHKAGDAAIIAALDEQVRALNRRHGKRRQRPFHLLVRGRQFNRSEGCWMAWERKRGKLEQFNRLLIERDSSPFAHWTGRRPGLEGMRFVVTVDADTMLPPGSVARLVGTLAHPLNRARFDEGAEGSSRAIRSSSLELRSRRRAAGARSSPACSPGTRRSISTAALFPTSIRICSAPESSWARASTTSALSIEALTAECPRTASSAMICSKERTPGSAWRPISSSMRASRQTIFNMHAGFTAGFAATGNCFPGSVGMFRRLMGQG